MRSNQIRTLFALTMLLVGAWGWQHWATARPLALQAHDLEVQVRAESTKTLRLQQDIAHLVHQLEQNTTRLDRGNGD